MNTIKQKFANFTETKEVNLRRLYELANYKCIDIKLKYNELTT